MVRSSGKFSFPVPGRKLKNTTKTDDASPTRSIPSSHEWHPRPEEPSNKAHRVLGTSEPMFRTKSKQSVSASPGFVSISVSEASYGSHHDDQRSMGDHDAHLQRAGVSRRPSSNVMGRAYSREGGQGSDYSTASNRLHPQASSSTMRSHYDAKSSPLSISQQTSDSAVRDMALRRGKPQVVPEYNSNGYLVSPLSPVLQEEARRKEQRRSKPARLDLSKLFPKPRTGEGTAYSNPLLSPAKMVNSPVAMSVASDYPFPKPMTREPTPSPNVEPKPKKLQRKQVSGPHIPRSPVQKTERDEHDNAKIHVRRPPKGVQHWFDAFDEDSDEVPEAPASIHAPTAVHPHSLAKLPDQLVAPGSAEQTSESHYLSPESRHDTFTHEDLVDVTRLTSSSQYSLQSTKTKESALSKTNFQDSSVLSFSSSEDEDDHSQAVPHMVPVRKSLDINDDSDVIIGQAQAFEVRPRRRPSAELSMLSSTSAATIEVMYTPEPPITPLHFPRTSSYSGSRRSSHVRQPSVIHEDEDYRPRTAVNTHLSPPAPSLRSVRTSASEPKPGSDGVHKFMAVTAEEEALLEMMRKKRAAMRLAQALHAGQAVEEQEQRRLTPVEHSRKPYRTSGFLADASPVRVIEHNVTRRASHRAPSPLQLPPRGRPRKARYDASVGSHQLRGSSTSDAWSEQHGSSASRITIPHHIPTPSVLSPLDPFSHFSPVLTASVTSPTTTEHASPLPSPLTPGLRAYEDEPNVKVANSDTSNDVDEGLGLDSSVVDALPGRTKSPKPPHDDSTHRRRRTASSGTDVSFPVPPKHSPTDLAALAEGLARQSSMEPQASRLSTKSSRRTSGLTLLTNGSSRNRQSSIYSSHSQASSHSHISSQMNGIEKRSSRHMTRKSSTGSMSVTSTSTRRKRTSVSEDVLAAWSSLGGTY